MTRHFEQTSRDRRTRIVVAGALAAVAVAAGVAALTIRSSTDPRTAVAATGHHCRAGARTLSTRGDVLYPEVGNGGYVSVHTATHTVYDASTNRFLAGNHVELTDRATQCLSSLSLDFERSAPGHPKGGPDMHVQSVDIDGATASFHFAQPAYPGDPNGPGDPDPRAHEASQHDPVGGPEMNPLPPACSPQLRRRPRQSDGAYANSQNGSQCPADKLVITPKMPVPDGHTFTITVKYTGTPGTHADGNGEQEGWFRVADGGVVATEPVGSEDWMPLNDYPSAKPTYDFSITTERGKTAIANGERVKVSDNPPDAEFPKGSATTVWHAPMPIASYLALTIVGDYTSKVRTVDGTRYYAFQDRHIPARIRGLNAKVIATQPGITHFEEGITGRFPFASDGIVAEPPGARFTAEEMESMIVFPALVDRGTAYHENFHQWWGDSVSEGNFTMAFFKEGLAELAQELELAREAAQKAGGLSTTAGQTAFEHWLVRVFDSVYSSHPSSQLGLFAETGNPWRIAPSRRTPATYIDLDAVYQRPMAAYLALREILGPHRFDAALRATQRRYAGASITEPQLEAAFATRLPDHSAACRTRLSQFFTQWFNTAYQGAGKPQITGPGLRGQPFYAHGCDAH